MGIARCASTYLFHLARAHAFVDGNNRLGATALETLLVTNGARLDATDDQVHDLDLSIAAGDLTRDDVDRWMEDKVRV